MSSNKFPPYLLQELPSLTEEIYRPLKNSQRIKYTCFDVSKTLIVFGANSGGIYVFIRDPCEFVQLIPSKDGAITRLSISADERHVGFANGRGVVTVTECEHRNVNSYYSVDVTSKEHVGNEVTAMLWGSAMLFCADDVGRVSVLQMPTFISKSIFQNVSQTIMCLDSRVCQLDNKDSMLLVSTLTRCYICDTAQEQYRQIGQKLRDGEYGACFVATDKITQNGALDTNKSSNEVKMFNIVDAHDSFNLDDKLTNTAIFAGRPSSRLWEASINGTVKKTHQYKQVLARQPSNIISKKSYDNGVVNILPFSSNDEGQSSNFPKIFSVNKSVLVSFKKDALYFLDIKDVDNTMWFNTYNDIVDCKLYGNILYLWLQSGDVLCLAFLKIDKLLVKCYLDKKYEMCAKLCALYSKFLLSSDELSTKLHILVGLKNIVQIQDTVKDIEDVLNKFEILKENDVTQMKSGIFLVNSISTQESSNELVNDKDDKKHILSTAPETMQTIKDLSLSMTGKLNTTKMIIREKWGDFEEKFKYLSGDKIVQIESPKPTEIKIIRIDSSDVDKQPIDDNDDIIYKDSRTFEIDNKAVKISKSTTENEELCKSFFEYFKLGLIADQSNSLNVTNSLNCGMKEMYRLMLAFKEHCIKIGAIEESEFAPNNIFLNYLSISPKRNELLDEIINDETLYTYFVDSCIAVNIKTRKLGNLGCECGFPLPYAHKHQTPEFSDIIDEFTEKQWCNNSKECYNLCKRMPHLWRKLLYLRRSDGLMTILNLILQILDENLLHTFLPQFTLETWDHAIQLYAKLYANRCLNCNKTFEHVSVKQTLSWDDFGALVIKSMGGRNAIKLMEKHAALISMGDLSMKFYHSCLLDMLFEKYDGTVCSQLIDAVYSAYEYEDAVTEICNLLRNTKNGQLNNTTLPIAVAAKSPHWGLRSIFEKITERMTPIDNDLSLKVISLQSIFDNLSVSNGHTDCSLCGLPLVNMVLIKDGGLWVFKCGHIFHGACLECNKVRFCPSCPT